MSLAPTDPTLTPPRRGTGQPALLPSWEGLGVGSGAQCAHKIRGNLSTGERVRGKSGCAFMGGRISNKFSSGGDAEPHRDADIGPYCLAVFHARAETPFPNGIQGGLFKFGARRVFHARVLDAPLFS